MSSLKKLIVQNKKVFLITVLQIALILMLASITLKEVINEFVFYFTEILLSFVFLKILFFDLKVELKKEHKYSIYFFAPLYLIIQISWFARTFLTELNNLFYFLGFILIIFIYFVFFKFVFGRNFVEGIVILSSTKIAVVKTDFDIWSFNTQAIHVVETNKKIKEGKTVKISFKRNFLGKKTAKIL